MSPFGTENSNQRTPSGLEQSCARMTAALLAALLTFALTRVASAEPKPPDPPSFRRDVAPILVLECLACHNDRKADGGLNLAPFARSARRQADGRGHPHPRRSNHSYLIESIRPGAAIRMPYKQPPLTDRQILILTSWVKAGASLDGAIAEENPNRFRGDILDHLPKVAMKVPVADPITSVAVSPDAASSPPPPARRSSFRRDLGQAQREL